MNDGIKAAKWSIESYDGMLYLKGERDTIYAIQKFMLVFPSEGNIFFYVIFGGGEDVESILLMETDQLSIDNEIIPIHELRVSRVNESRLVNSMYQVTPEILGKLRAAKSIGYHPQHSTLAAMFVGFDSFPFEQGAAKLAGLIDVFFRERSPDEWTLPPAS